MTHPTHHTNGASLEDCHTNFFALMDLCGIKWRRLGAENVLCDDPLDDPVLLSYGRCLASDILCVWRRVQPTSRNGGGGGGAGNNYMLDHHGGQRGFHDLQVPPPPSNHGHHGHGHHLQHHGASAGHGTSTNGHHHHHHHHHHHSIFKKELWIFWYGEEPDLTNILCTELAELDQGNWECGLSYECRTLLFKAIHNRIERSFLSREHVRLGKWFVQPYDAREKPELKSPHSLSFTFFIHGESTVCVCVDVREPPLVRKLGLQHVLAAQGSHNGTEVILSPYGQAGVLTGQVYKDSDAAVQKLLDEWRQFYPIDAKLSNREVGPDGVQMPAFVEVIVGGVRLRYPSCYVLLPEDDPGSAAAAASSTGTACPLPGSASAAATVAGTSAACNGSTVGAGGKGNVPAAMSSVSLTPPTSPCDAGMMSMPSGTAVVGRSSTGLLPGSSPCPPGAPYASCGSASGQHASDGARGCGVLGRERPSLEITSHAYQDSTLFGVGSRAVQSVSAAPGASNPNPSQTVNQNTAAPAPPPSNPSTGTGESGASGPTSSREDTVGTWDFYEPTQKAVCSCPKCRKPRSSGGSVKSGSGASGGTNSGGGTSVATGGGGGGGAKKCERGDKSEKQQQSRHLRHMTPFHRRSPVNDETAAFETDVLTGRASSTPATNPFKGGAVPRSATPSGLPQLRSLGSEQPTSVGSPASAAPSPLVASSHSQPASVTTQPDAALPALSPHTAMASQEPQETASGQQQQQQPDEPMNVESHEAQQQPQDAYGKEGGPKSAVEQTQAFSPFPAPGSVAAAPASAGNADSSNQAPSAAPCAATGAVTCPAVGKQSAEVANWVQMHRVNSGCAESVHPGLKRPVLPATSYEDLVDDEPLAESLYDYTALNAWLQHPVKKFKPDPLHRQNSTGDGLPSPATTSLYKREPSTPQALGGSDSTSPKPTDPYEFVDDFPTTVSMAGFKCKNETTNKDDEKAKDSATAQTPLPLPQGGVAACDTGEASAAGKGAQAIQTGACASQATPGQTDLVGSPPALKPQTTMATIQKLYRERDRKVTYEDLEQLFDTSDDDTYNEGFHMPSPPGSVKTMNYLVDDTCPSKNKTAGGISILGPTELSRMFPTPPSLEQASPCAQTNANDGPSAEMDAVCAAAVRERCDIYPSYGSPMDETGRDWSYVFKTPVVVKFWGSSKYAPLATLPSQMLPPLVNPVHVVYKPSWQYPPVVAVEKQHLPHVTSQPLPAERAGGNHCAPSPAAGFLAAPGHGHGHHQSAMSGYELSLPPCAQHAQPTAKSLLDVVVSSSSIPEAHSLLVNLALSDSVLNLFRDHNFDSCTMCVCHMNVKGSDVGLYLPDTSVAQEEPPYKCSCGFSAVVNRRFGHRAGLFYEDEAEIGAADECCSGSERKRSLLSAEAVKDAAMAGSALDPEATNPTPQYVLELLQTQCSTLFSPCSTFSKASGLHRRLTASAGWLPGPVAGAAPGASLHVLDGSDVTAVALESVAGVALKAEDARKNYLHKWPFLPAKLPCNSHDTVRLLRALQPLLQEAIHKKLTTQFWEATTTATYNVSGPLTWRQFLKLAGRSTEDQCEPQPIPSLLVGYDKDWIALSPFALKYWEKLLLEPYSLSRDVAYIVVAPDNEYVIGKVKTFFKELSGTYEVCRLGRHVPIAKVLRDGIMRVGKTAAKKLADQPVDEWFNLIGDSPVAAKLKLYAQVCRHHLAPHLALQPLDRTLLDPPPPQTKVAEKVVPAASPMPPPSTPENPDKDKAATPKPVESGNIGDPGDGSGGASKDGSGSTGGSQSAGGQQGASGGYASGATVQDPWEQDDDPCPPAIVIYMVDPFTYACDNPDVHRLVMLGLMRCYSQMLCYLPESMQNNINLQIIPQESILETSFGEEKCKQLDRLKSLAFSVFSQCHRILAHQSTVKSLTGFGTAAAAEQFLKTKDEKNSSLYRMYSPPFILAPMKDKQTQLGESFGDRREKCTILFCTYCISEDQRWLLATCTDDRGEILETRTINVEIPNRHRRKKASARKIGLQKLMDWILGVMSTSVMPWRLVVGRLGRLGQGELKGWSSLLSRKTLLRASKHLREICKMCMFMSAQDAPCILSACLVSLEADTVLRIMPDQFSPDEDFGSSCNSCNLSTPQDASCTHILVFPTSATTQSSQVTCQQDTIDTLVPNFPEEDILSALDEEGHPMTDINAIFNWTDTSPGPSPQDSPRRESSSRPGSPGLGMSERHSPFQNGGFNRGVDDLGGDHPEEAPQPLQQPLALAYYVSTARAGPLPKWFWSSCGHLEEMCPAFLKSALHVHSPAVQQSSDDLFQQQSHPLNYHPLDSNLTTDVLRYVLEGYNALSWLSIDPATHDRRSCLPVHIQVLMQMYFTMAALV